MDNVTINQGDVDSSSHVVLHAAHDSTTKDVKGGEHMDIFKYKSI